MTIFPSSTARERFYEVLMGEDEERVCLDIPEASCHEQPRNFLTHFASLAASRTADGLLDPRLVLAWLLGALGAPAFFLEGAAAGWTILAALAVLALARSANSVSHKDVLGKTVSKSTRGTVAGSAGTLSAVLILAFGVLLGIGLLERSTGVIAGALCLAGLLWIFAALMFASLSEEPGATEGGRNALSMAIAQFGLLRDDPQLLRFTVIRCLLLAIPLALPFLVALEGRASGAQGVDGRGLEEVQGRICRQNRLLSTVSALMSMHSTYHPDVSIIRERIDMSFDPRQPYSGLPGIPPAADIETKPLLKACIEARAGLAELKSVGALIPNQAVLINTIPLLEAQASSEIENIVTTRDALFRFAQDEDSADPATKEALRYRAALREGFESLRERPLSTSTAVRVCSRLKDRDMQIRRVPGTALSNAATGEVIYTPPQGEPLLREKLANWERFIHDETDVDPVIRMAVAHYQFEAIHPFLDGNGRTGRVLNLLLLVEHGLLDQPVLYLSRYILRRRADYYRLLLAVTRDGAWEEWIAFMLDAVTETARWTSDRIRAIQSLHAHATDFVRTHASRIYSRELVDALFLQPYCRIQNLVDGGIAKRQTASVYLKQLADLGMLEELKVGREKLFLHPNFVHLLTSDEHPVLPYAPIQEGW